MPCVFLPPKRCKTLDASLFEKLQVLNDLEGEQRQLRDLKTIVDAHKLQAGLMSSLQRWCHICWYVSYPAMATQADRRLGDLYTSLASIEDLWVSTITPSDCMVSIFKCHSSLLPGATARQRQEAHQ